MSKKILPYASYDRNNLLQNDKTLDSKKWKGLSDSTKRENQFYSKNKCDSFSTTLVEKMKIIVRWIIDV